MHDQQGKETKSHGPKEHWGAVIFIWLVLHAIPVPCPIRDLRSLKPPEFWKSLGFFDAPWNFAQPLLSAMFPPTEVRDVGWVLLFYEPLWLCVALWFVYRWPHWFRHKD